MYDNKEDKSRKRNVFCLYKEQKSIRKDNIDEYQNQHRNKGRKKIDNHILYSFPQRSIDLLFYIIIHIFRFYIYYHTKKKEKINIKKIKKDK